MSEQSGADASISVSLQTATEDVTIIFQREATGMLPQLHMLFAIARDGATQSGSPAVLGSKWGGGFPLSPSPSRSIHPSVPRGHPVQMGNRNDLEAASVTSLGDRVSRQ